MDSINLNSERGKIASRLKEARVLAGISPESKPQLN